MILFLCLCLRPSLSLLSLFLPRSSPSAHQDSVWFRRLLELVLGLGNYLNGGTPRGRAHGFKLDSLVKLATIKSIDSKMTLLHYLAELVNKQEAELLDVGEELTHSKDCSRLSATQLKADMQGVKKGLGNVQKHLEVQLKKDQKLAGDYFIERMQPFVE